MSKPNWHSVILATLLIAMGVGVLIGRTGHDNSAPAAARQPVQVVTVAGAGAGTAAATDTSATAAKAATAKKAAKHHKAKASSHSHISGASDVQKTAAANGVKLPPPVVKVGGKCPQGAKGCSGGKFTGQFFGGG